MLLCWHLWGYGIVLHMMNLRCFSFWWPQANKVAMDCSVSNVTLWQGDKHLLLLKSLLYCIYINIFLFLLEQFDNIDGAPAPKKDMKNKKKKKNKKEKKEEELTALKQELEMDEHKIPLEQLFSRYETDVDNVSISLLNMCNLKWPSMVQYHSHCDNILVSWCHDMILWLWRPGALVIRVNVKK